MAPKNSLPWLQEDGQQVELTERNRGWREPSTLRDPSKQLRLEPGTFLSWAALATLVGKQKTGCDTDGDAAPGEGEATGGAQQPSSVICMGNTTGLLVGLMTKEQICFRKGRQSPLRSR